MLCAFAERAVDLVACTDGRLLPLVTLLFSCVGAELRVAELTIDFWVSLQDTPLAQRHEQLRQPLYRELLRRLCTQCTLPADFATWDDVDDAEEFARFREQSATEVLTGCLQLLDTEFVAAMRAQLEGAKTWQALELVTFVTRALHIEFKSVLGADADVAHKEGVGLLLAEALAPIAEGRVADQPAPLVASAARLVGSYGKWLASSQPAMLEGCVRCLLGALAVPEAAEHAASAFRALCVHAQRVLGRPETVAALLGACVPSITNAELSAGLRIALVEGLARLVAVLPAEGAQAALGSLVSAPCTLLQMLLSTVSPPSPGAAPPPAEAAAEAAVQLQLVASGIRFCDRFGEVASHPVLPVLQGCWPLLMQAAATFRADAGFVTALAELYRHSMFTLKQLLVPLLPQMLAQLEESFASTPTVGCLTCIALALETYGGERASQGKPAVEGPCREVLSHVLGSITARVCAFLATAPDPESQPELLTAFWEACHRCLVCQPGLLLSLPCSAELFDAAIACVRHQEFQHTRAVLTFVCLFMCPTEHADEFRETSAMCLQGGGAKLLAACLSGLASASPDNLVDHQIEVRPRARLISAPTACQADADAALSRARCYAY